MNELEYTKDYIKRALSLEQLEAPDKSKANGTYAALEALYENHKIGGIAAAQNGWVVIQRMHPDIAVFGPKTKLRHADKLDELARPTHLTTKYPIYDGGFNVMFGPSGSGKSFLALDIASGIAIETPVVYIAGEGLHGYSDRWKAWKTHHGILTAELYFYEEALQVMDDAQLMEFMIDVRTNHPPSLVIIDTMARSAVGMDENSSREVGLFIERVDYIRKELECSTLIVHHTGKSGYMRGSSSLYAAADAVISVRKSEDVIRATNNADSEGKNKYGPDDWNMFFRLLPVKGEGYEGAVLVETKEVIDTPSDENPLSNTQSKILEALDGYEEGLPIKAIIGATGISQSTAYRNLKKLMEAKYLQYKDERYIITGEGTEALLGGE